MHAPQIVVESPAVMMVAVAYAVGALLVKPVTRTLVPAKRSASPIVLPKAVVVMVAVALVVHAQPESHVSMESAKRHASRTVRVRSVAMMAVMGELLSWRKAELPA